MSPEVELTPSEAWDLRAALANVERARDLLGHHEREASAVCARACKRAGSVFDPGMTVHIEGGRVLLRYPDPGAATVEP